MIEVIKVLKASTADRTMKDISSPLHDFRLVHESRNSIHIMKHTDAYNFLQTATQPIGIEKSTRRRLAPAYFSPNYKYFDQLLQKVINKTTVLILVFKEFLPTSLRALTSVLYAKGYHDFLLKNFCVTVPKISSRNLSVFQKISGIEKC